MGPSEPLLDLVVVVLKTWAQDAMPRWMSEPASGSANRGSPEIGRDAIEIVLVCAETDRRRILDVVPVLERESMRVRVLSGVEHTLEVLPFEITRRGEGTVFVVCMSPSLQGEALRRVVETFSGRPAVNTRVLVVEVDLRKVFGLVLSVRRAATVLRRQMEFGTPEDSCEGRVCDVGTIPDHIGLPPGGERRPHLRVVGIDLTSATDDAFATPRSETRPRSESQSRSETQASKAANAEAPAIDAASTEVSAIDGLGSVAARTEVSSRDALANGPESVEAFAGDALASGPESVEAFAGDALARKAESIDAPARIEGPASDAIATRQGSAADPSASTSRVSEPIRHATVALELAAAAQRSKAAGRQEVSRRGGWLRTLAAGGLVVLGALVVFEARGDTVHAAQLATPPEVVPKRERPVIPLVAASLRRASASSDVSDSDPQAVETRVLLERVAAGALLQSEELVVFPPSGEPTDWWAAANRCKALSVGGVQGWHLPKTYELRELRRTRMLTEGTYWSFSRVSRAEEPSNWVMDGPSGQMTAVAKTGTAGSVCLRRMP